MPQTQLSVTEAAVLEMSWWQTRFLFYDWKLPGHLDHFVWGRDAEKCSKSKGAEGMLRALRVDEAGGLYHALNQGSMAFFE